MARSMRGDHGLPVLMRMQFVKRWRAFSDREVLCKPWMPRNRNLFTKADFVINMRNCTIECPAGEIE